MSGREYDPKFRSAYNNGLIKGIKKGKSDELSRIISLLNEKRAHFEYLALASVLQPDTSEKWIAKIKELETYTALIKEDTDE